MTKEDFIILRNSITMRQLANSYGFHIDRRGFIRCPFHDFGSERTPSLKIFPEFRGFHCKACGTGGDVTKFVELYEGVETKEAAMLLSERFNVPISETGEISETTRLKAQQAILEHEQQSVRQNEIETKLRHLSTVMTALNQLIHKSKVLSDVWCYCQNELAVVTGEWEYYFGELRKV